MNSFYYQIDSPIGPLHLTSTNKALTAIHHTFERLQDWNKNDENFKNEKNIIIEKTIFQLTEYFNGKRKHFNIPIDLSYCDHLVNCFTISASPPSHSGSELLCSFIIVCFSVSANPTLHQNNPTNKISIAFFISLNPTLYNSI